jgi:hypothetical protein
MQIVCFSAPKWVHIGSSGSGGNWVVSIILKLVLKIWGSCLMTYYISYVPKLANENMRFLKEECDILLHLKLVVSRKYIWQGVILSPPSPKSNFTGINS